jgi:hypothetical protein
LRDTDRQRHASYLHARATYWMLNQRFLEASLNNHWDKLHNCAL